MGIDRSFLQERITQTKAAIVAYENALIAVGDGKIQSHTMDTGQNRVTVTRNDIASMKRVLDGLYNLLAGLEARLSGSVIHITPAW